MRKFFKPLAIAVVSFVFAQCANDKFKIEKGKVGQLTANTTVTQLDEIFKGDSIVKVLSEGSKGSSVFQDEDKYLIYEKGGKHLLTIIPTEQLDSSSTIKSVEVFDSRYKTKTGLNVNSVFSEINGQNSISKVETSISSATLFIDDLNATIAIDKEELGVEEFSFQKVTLEQIPDIAKIKSFTIWFE